MRKIFNKIRKGISLNSQEKEEIFSWATRGADYIPYNPYLVSFIIFNLSDCIKYIKDIRDIIRKTKSIDINHLFNFLKLREDGLKLSPTKETFRLKYGEKHYSDLWDTYLLSINNTEDGFIKRYGEVEGKRRYNIFKEKSTHSKESMIKLYGKVEGTKRWDSYLKSNACYAGKRPNSVDYWVAKGYSLKEAELKVKEAQSLCSRDSFISRYGEEEGEAKYLELCNNRRQQNTLKYLQEKYGKAEGLEVYKKINNTKSNSLEVLIDKYGVSIGTQKYTEAMDKRRETFIAKGIWVSDSERDDVELYYKLVDRVTSTFNLSNLENIDKRGSHNDNEEAYHLDHMFSRVVGFRQGILPYYIGHIANLECIPYKQNLSKGAKCSLSLDSLIERIKEYDENKKD